MKERIQKVLGNAGVASRRNIEQMVLDGRISVNGKVIRTLPILIDPERDSVAVDLETVKLRGKTKTGPHDSAGDRLYLMLNKPKGVYSTNVAQGAQKLAIDLLPEELNARVYPVGRLDAQSKGLLLMTNDGELTQYLTHPRYGVAKTYRATIDGVLSEDEKRQLEKGVWMASPLGKAFKTAPIYTKPVKTIEDRSIIEITLKEGKQPEIRRLLAKLGHKVRDLVRIRLGPLNLEGLKPGHFRPLTPKEVRQLRQLMEKHT